MASKLIQSAINYLAGYLSAIPAIKSGRYTLYTNVPVKGLICNDTGKPPVKNESISDIDGSEETLDIVICHDKDILTCIVIDDGGTIRNVMDNTLKGISYITISEKNVVDYVSTFVNSRISLFEKDPESIFKYSLQDVSRLKAVCSDLALSDGDDGELLYNMLVENSANTHLGDLCGVFYKYEVNALNGSITRFPVITHQSQSNLKVDIYSEHISCDGRMSLGKRIKFLERGMPSCPEAADHAAELLQNLLDSPVENLFHLQPEWLNNFKEDVEKIKEHSRNYELSSGQIKIETYKDIMDFLYHYYLESKNNIECSNEVVVSNCIDVFIDLIVGMKPPNLNNVNEKLGFVSEVISLKEHIKRINTKIKKDYPILNASVGNYIYAASLLNGNCYPHLMYEKSLLRKLKYMKLGDSKSSLLSIAERIVRYNSISDNQDECFSLLEMLFIEPVSNQNNNKTYERN